MMARATVARRAPIVVAVTLYAMVLSVSAASAAGINARVHGTFSMRARVTAAVNVRGERAGQVLRRRWVITSSDCRRNTCRRLQLDRQRSDHRYSRVTLLRTGAGRYRGRGAFEIALSCRGRVSPHGSRALYSITMRVTAATTIGGVRFARRIAATYDNRKRSDTTRCPLGPSHDAARYRGRVTSHLPLAPRAGFSVLVNPTTDIASFTDTSSPKSGRARRRWDFGDPLSGASDRSASRDPRHRFSAPGAYEVRLTETDHDGLSATATQRIIIPGPPTAAFSAATNGRQVTFVDQSVPGIGGASITSRAWNFGDPISGPSNSSSLADPTHLYTAAGTYTVTLTVTDQNGRPATYTAPITVAGG
jgi:PKD repeat protein